MIRIVRAVPRAVRLALIAAAGSAVLAAGCAPPPKAATAPEKVKGAAPAPAGANADFQAIVYQVAVPAVRLGDLDAAALADQPASPAEFALALARFGPTKALYRVDQAVNLSSDRISIGTRVPIVSSTRTGSGGERLSSVSYQDVGAMFLISGTPPDAKSDSRTVKLAVELSVIDAGDVEIAPSVKAPVYRKATLAHNGPLQPGRPIVMLSADATGGTPGQAVVFVCRAVVGQKER